MDNNDQSEASITCSHMRHVTSGSGLNLVTGGGGEGSLSGSRMPGLGISTNKSRVRAVLANQRPVFRSRDMSGPIRCQYSGHVICLDQTPGTGPHRQRGRPVLHGGAFDVLRGFF